jgi:membrane protease YdiL (CAAX protease family)
LRRYRELTGWLNGLVGVKKSIVWSLVGAGAGVLIAALEFTLDHRGLNWWVILFMTCIGALRAFSFERDKKPDKSEPPQPPVNRYTRM